MHTNRENGFTLSEMMVVIAVMSILMLAVVPTMSRFMESSRLSGAVGTMASDLHYARSIANAQHTNYEMRRGGSGYSIVRVSPESLVLQRTLPKGVSFATVDTTTFYGWGLTEASTITLRMRDRSDIVRLSSAAQVTRD